MEREFAWVIRTAMEGEDGLFLNVVSKSPRDNRTSPANHFNAARSMSA